MRKTKSQNHNGGGFGVTELGMSLLGGGLVVGMELGMSLEGSELPTGGVEMGGVVGAVSTGLFPGKQGFATVVEIPPGVAVVPLEFEAPPAVVVVVVVVVLAEDWPAPAKVAGVPVAGFVAERPPAFADEPVLAGEEDNEGVELPVAVPLGIVVLLQGPTIVLVVPGLVVCDAVPLMAPGLPATLPARPATTGLLCVAAGVPCVTFGLPLFVLGDGAAVPVPLV